MLYVKSTTASIKELITSATSCTHIHGQTSCKFHVKTDDAECVEILALQINEKIKRNGNDYANDSSSANMVEGKNRSGLRYNPAICRSLRNNSTAKILNLLKRKMKKNLCAISFHKYKEDGTDSNESRALKDSQDGIDVFTETYRNNLSNIDSFSMIFDYRQAIDYLVEMIIANQTKSRRGNLYENQQNRNNRLLDRDNTMNIVKKFKRSTNISNIDIKVNVSESSIETNNEIVAFGDSNCEDSNTTEDDCIDDENRTSKNAPLVRQDISNHRSGQNSNRKDNSTPYPFLQFYDIDVNNNWTSNLSETLLENSEYVEQKTAVTHFLNNSRDINEKRMPARKTVYLLGLFELSTQLGVRLEGHSELAAARLAIRHINMKRVLPGYHLELITNDTQCDPGVGVDRFFHALYTQRTTRMVMLLGSACSEVTMSLAKVVPYWNIVQVSFGSTSPALSDRAEFPLFFRTAAPDSSHHAARVALARRFGWDAVSTLGDALSVNELVAQLERANITCTAAVTFAEADLADQMRKLQISDTRIIIGSFSYEFAPKIFCEAYKLGMYGSDYAWIVQGRPEDVVAGKFWKRRRSRLGEMLTEDCSARQFAIATEGVLLVSSHNGIVGMGASLSGLTNEQFKSAIREAIKDKIVSRYAPQTYDAVWAMALALRGAEQHWRTRQRLQMNERSFDRNKTVTTSVARFDYTRTDMATEFLDQFARLNFSGISGPVSFNGADRVGTTAFYQIQAGKAVTVALFHPALQALDFECVGCVPVQWSGQADASPPVARRVFRLRVLTIAPTAFTAITCLATIGITLSIAFLVFNLHFRRLKSIKLSSPRLNNMAAIGCIFVYTAVILLGLDHATLKDTNHFSTVCTARVYLLSAGFSLAFGSMFTKTYRVHHIFTRGGYGTGRCSGGAFVRKRRLLQDTQLMLAVCALLVADGLLVTVWVAVDPMQRTLRNLTLEISSTDRSVVYQPQIEVCASQHTRGWLGALYAYKGLLLIVGVYMAWETRHVKVPALNDSEYIGMSVYSVVITSGIVAVLANLVSERATLAFVTTTGLILISTTSTLCLLFFPKLHAILMHHDPDIDPVVESMGLKIEYNTRRFVVDDKRELQYRVEVQNRVYRREIAALDLEIGRLEKLLYQSSKPNSSSSSSATSSMATGIHKKPEVSVIDEISTVATTDNHPRTPSIGGGLPLLLLSVLPPVIPRASWPSADHCSGIPTSIFHGVTFSSESKLNDSYNKKSNQRGEIPAIDLFNLCPRLSAETGKSSMLDRLKNLFGSKTSIRKVSTSSIGHSNFGIAAALKVHMGQIASFVPGSNKTQRLSTGNMTSFLTDPLDGNNCSTSGNILKRHSFSPSSQCCSDKSVNVASDTSLSGKDDIKISSLRKLSLGLCLSKKSEPETIEYTTEPHVNFNIPTNTMRKSIVHQQSQPVLSFRERAKGSPRFPHKIMPTCSLNTLEDRRKSHSYGAHVSVIMDNSNTNQSNNQFQMANRTKPVLKPANLKGKWHSMEDSTFSVPLMTRRGSGDLTVSYLQPNSDLQQPRTSSYSPSCDVWGISENGTPFSEFVALQKLKHEKENSEKQCQNDLS